VRQPHDRTDARFIGTRFYSGKGAQAQPRIVGEGFLSQVSSLPKSPDGNTQSLLR